MLKFLGIGSAFNTTLGNTSAFIKKHCSILLIDCGSTVFSRLQKLGLLSDVSYLYIAITHTHPDHIGSLGELIFYSHYALNCKPRIFFPDAHLLSSILDNMGVNAEFYEILSSPQIKISDEFLSSADLTFIPSSHVERIPSYSILIKCENHSIFYSGDSNKISDSILNSLENGYIDILYQDTCSLDYTGNPHLYIGKLIEYVKPSLRSKICCMHLDQNFERIYAIQSGFNVAEVIKDL
ncbi:MBL fold metallo-hydrolase [Acetivibrio cellulolyticus]|uniref:MBL fold metallo-hydrolase n=1 Tax=Acetivibrio cellulolyticus TaxID=35830 RepID=UPI0001E2D482|nr:MBL fold metallo-hydrolase [Acetivibrio cellulolyticus]